jgi:hypothetical protein
MRSALLAPALLLAAVAPGLDQYAGRWILIESQSDDIAPAIERVVRRMNFLIRGIARSRLRKTQIAFPHITIVSGERFRIDHEGGTAVWHGTAGTAVKTTAPDGKPINVRLFAGPPLRETYESEEGSRENTYVLSEGGGKLTVHVRITSPKLPEPLVYSLVYRRSD